MMSFESKDRVKPFTLLNYIKERQLTISGVANKLMVHQRDLFNLLLVSFRELDTAVERRYQLIKQRYLKKETDYARKLILNEKKLDHLLGVLDQTKEQIMRNSVEAAGAH